MSSRATKVQTRSSSLSSRSRGREMGNLNFNEARMVWFHLFQGKKTVVFIPMDFGILNYLDWIYLAYPRGR